ncbi:LCP family protein [Streptomyces polyrhachis]|uniref:LCP family protein n=1 Tax=Streptomyces polyrhachis TaxID=1282885 RepID=A0ABW2GND9_9ACTN
MDDWPNGWSEGNARGARGGGGPHAEPTRTMPHVPRQPSHGGYGGDGGRGYGDDGYNDGRVYGRDGRSDADGYGGSGHGGSGHGGEGYARPRPDWRRRITRGLVILMVLLLVTGVATYFWADSKLRKDVDLAKVIDRPAEGDGTTYLIVGSDSREGMSAEEKKNLHTGSAAGKRTDSMMILHRGGNGPTLISLPRDSWVTIPNFVGSESGKSYPARGGSKLNAAYAMDGPELLTRTVEFNTGLRIDHYVEIGFSGFADIVDAVGGVEMDIPKAFKDRNSGADFQAGRQTLDGREALAFVRTRYAFARSDLDRTKNQQKFLAALANQAATPTTVLNPFTLYPLMGAGLDSLIVDKDMGPYELARMFWTMKGVTGGEGVSMNMPLAGSAPQGSLKWDMPKVKQLVQQLNNDEKVTVKGD